MFSTLGLFRQIACPAGSECHVPSCLFAHAGVHDGPDKRVEESISHRDKRVKYEHKSPAKVPLQQSDKPFFGILNPTTNITEGEPYDTDKKQDDVVRDGDQDRPPARRSISPPVVKKKADHGPIHSAATIAMTLAKETKAESLNPRKVAKAPTSHDRRLQFVKKLFEHMSRLNSIIRQSQDESHEGLEMDNAGLIKSVLDEEETIALGKVTAYEGAIRQRIATFAKMSAESWKELRLQAVSPKTEVAATQETKKPVDLSTGLNREQELQVLPHLYSDQSKLARYGYVITPPTAAEIIETKAAEKLNQGYEKCDRCGTRFQVFPDRREDGALTAGGKCTYHHGRAVAPQSRGDNQHHTGRQAKRYSCCTQEVGVSAGCTTSDTHVYKLEDKNRLASAMPFQRTPLNEQVPTGRAVAFDCEMCYTVLGMELVRLTATSWPLREELIDVLVRPLGAVLDLCTRFSGVSSDDFMNAYPYDSTSLRGSSTSDGQKMALRIVDSPVVARQLLFDLISPDTPLIGHALENDLIATRIVHPTIIDTVVLFPHRRGLPNRPALRILAKDHLNRDIQIGGAAGHNSKEDAIAAGDLVMLALGDKWKKMKKDGYHFDSKGKLVAPHGRAGVASIAEKMREEVGEMKKAAETEAQSMQADMEEKGAKDGMDFWG